MIINGGTHTHVAVVLYGAQDLRIEHVKTPAIQPDEVQIAPRVTGICGTDVHYYQNGKNGPFAIGDPLILGHECAGEVIAIGSDVKSLQVGDRVVVEPQVACRKCNQCKKGRYNLCPSLKFTGSASVVPPIGGSLRRVYSRPADSVYKIPDSMSYTEGAMIEPLSVAIHAVRRAGLQSGQSVIIIGTGAVGLLCARAATFSGSSTIGMIDIDQSRLDFALNEKFGGHAFQIPPGGKDGESKSDFAAHMVSGPVHHMHDLTCIYLLTTIAQIPFPTVCSKY
jgi:L-iditol 2-dehydrogenase